MRLHVLNSAPSCLWTGPSGRGSPLSISQSPYRPRSRSVKASRDATGTEPLGLERFGTYKQLVASRAGSSFPSVAKVLSGLSLENLIGSLESDEVVVRVTHAGVNGGCETFRCRAEHAFARNTALKDFPLGAEGVGRVVAVGASSQACDAGRTIRVNTPVMFVGGAFSEYVKVKLASCMPIPDAVPEYAALRISGHVAYSALMYKVKLRPDDVVLVTAGAGATGTFAVQVAKRAGCHVVATCRNAVKAGVLKHLGADRVIDYSMEDIRTVLEQEYHKCVDICYEGVGGKLLEDVWSVALKEGGTVLSVGYISQYPHNRDDVVKVAKQSNEAINLPPSEELFWRAMTCNEGGKTFIGNVWPEDVEVRQQALTEAVALVEHGELECVVDPRRFTGLEAAADAVSYMLSGEAVGKVVIELS